MRYRLRGSSTASESFLRCPPEKTDYYCCMQVQDCPKDDRMGVCMKGGSVCRKDVCMKGDVDYASEPCMTLIEIMLLTQMCFMPCA